MPTDKKSSRQQLSGRVAFITGASRGIGFAIAQLLSREGCTLIITARDQAALDKSRKLLQKNGAAVFAIACDVSDPSSVEALFVALRKKTRRLDILVNNAGISPAACNIRDLPYPIWKEVLAINLDGLFLITQRALKWMKRGGMIVNILSVAAKETFPGSAAYNASKHGGLGFTDTLREELRETGIRVLAVFPGATDTAIWDTYRPDASRRNMMSPETVAQAAVNAILLPENSTVEELKITPSAGAL